jgi:hypothetical protein
MDFKCNDKLRYRTLLKPNSDCNGIILLIFLKIAEIWIGSE